MDAVRTENKPDDRNKMSTPSCEEGRRKEVDARLGAAALCSHSFPFNIPTVFLFCVNGDLLSSETSQC